MDACGTARRLGVGLATLVLLAGCGAGPGPTVGPPTATPATLASDQAATPTPGPTPTVVVTRDIAYESSNPMLTPGLLDVYAPVEPGPWPVVVMLPGNVKGFLSDHARRVADLGFVVFVATWDVPSTAPTFELGLATGSQAACAVEFARSKAPEYGGDPTAMLLFGHSAGANNASYVAFTRPDPSPGCLGDARPGAIDALVTWDGDWMLQTTYMGWDELIAADPRIYEGITQWTELPAHKDLRVAMLSEAHPNADFNYERPLHDKAAMDAFFAPRDPTGVLRAQLEANGALADGVLDALEAQQLLFSILEKQGNPVTLDLMPDTNHIKIGAAGWPVFVAAFEKAAGRS